MSSPIAPGQVARGQVARGQTGGGRIRDQGESARRREEILAVATELFSRQGYLQTSLIDIGQRLGISGPAIYHYFDRKDAILFEIRDRIVTGMLDRVERVVDSQADPVAALDSILREHTTTLLENVDANIVYDRERGLLPPDTEAAIRRSEREYESAVRAVYARGVAAGGLMDIDPMIAVGTLLAGCNWAHRFSRRSDRTTIGSPELVDSIVTPLLRGFVVERTT
jgi:AcrR family transcriptional regulator